MEKEPMKIKLSTCIIIVVLAIAVVLTIGYCYINNQKYKEIDVANENVIDNSINNSVENNQTLNNIEKNEVTTENNTIPNDETKENTEEKNEAKTTEKKPENIYNYEDMKSIKETLNLYYKFLAASEISTTSALENVLGLTVYTVQDPDYAPKNYKEHPQSEKYRWTGIKYSDFEGELWYVTNNVIKQKFPEFVEYKRYLYINEKNNNKKFEYKILSNEIQKESTKNECICKVTVKNNKTGKKTTNTITMGRGNGDFVINNIK